MQNSTSHPIGDSAALPDIHIRQWENRSGVLTFIVALAALIAEALLVQAVIEAHVMPVGGIMLHLLILLLLGLYALASLSSHRENRFALMLFLMVAALGPFGAGGVMLAIVWHTYGRKEAPEFEELFESLLPSQPKSLAQEVYDNIMSGKDESNKRYSIIPFMDVLAFGDVHQKRRVLEKITLHFHPSFAPLFKKALNDPNNVIRVQAAMAVAKIESRFLRRMLYLSSLRSRYMINIRSTTTIGKIEGNFLRRMMDLSPLKSRQPLYASTLLAIAEHCDDYAFTGLLDADRERSNRKKALECYQTYLTLQPHDFPIRMKVGRLLMRSGNYEKACDWLAQMIGQTGLPGADADAVAGWYSEALFACGRYEELRQYRTSIANRPVKVPAVDPLRAAGELWSGAAA